MDTCELEAARGEEAITEATGEGVVGIGGKDLFLGLEDGEEEAYMELASEPCVMLVPRLGDLERWSAETRLLGPGIGGAVCSSGECESTSSVIDGPLISFEGPSTVTSGLARELDEPSLECCERSAMRRLDGEPDLPPKPFVLIILMLACGVCLTVVPARFNNNCWAKLGCELLRLGKVADIGTFGIGMIS